MTYQLLDLFSGIGGFSVGLERSGAFRTVAMCERARYPRKVLAKRFPGVPVYDNVETLTADRLRADGIAVDAICGGFPCQDISKAGSGDGLEGERSRLWKEFERLIGELRPRIAIVENSATLLNRGLGAILGGLASLGYDAEWHCLPAAALGARHRRDRIWIIISPQDVSHSDCPRWEGRLQHWLAHAQGWSEQGDGPSAERSNRRRWSGHGFWQTEPELGRVADGIRHRVDRLRCLGNAVVPQVPELLGLAIGDDT
jgi:DNA (cytosine-5)-methyltransferase 1